MARLLIITGIILIFAGVLYHIAPWLFTWFGRLPGDIRIQSERARVFIPITSMILISIVLTAAIHMLRRLL